MKTTLKYDHYFNYCMVLEALRQLQSKFPGFINLCFLTKTKENRDLVAVQLTDPSTGTTDKKPALYIDGTHHATEYVGTMMVLYFIDILLSNDEYSDLLKTTSFYCIPCVSPDGMDVALSKPEYFMSSPYEVDSFSSGLVPKDMDGDGVIRTMRIESPYGVWKIDDQDPRLMKKRLPYETEGKFYNIYVEGVLQNWDGLDIFPVKGTSSMIIGSKNFNLNYPFGFEPSEASGKYPLSFPETRAVADFILAHKNIGWVISLHAPCGLYFYAPAAVPIDNLSEEDRIRYEEVSSVIREMTGFPTNNIYDATGGGGGCLLDWTQFYCGIPSCTIEIYDAEAQAGKAHLNTSRSLNEQIDQYRRILDWDRLKFGGRYYKPWTPFLHPQLGEIEIGGLDTKGLLEAPPPELLEANLSKTVGALLMHAKLLPHLVIEKVEQIHIAKNTWEISAVIGNTGWLPTYLSYEAVRRKIDHPIQATIYGAECIGNSELCIGHLAGFSGVKATASIYGFGCDTSRTHEAPKRIRKKIAWTVCGTQGTTVTVKVWSKTAGTAESSLSLE